jgi:hypothetical protein
MDVFTYQNIRIGIHMLEFGIYIYVYISIYIHTNIYNDEEDLTLAGIQVWECIYIYIYVYIYIPHSSEESGMRREYVFLYMNKHRYVNIVIYICTKIVMCLFIHVQILMHFFKFI